MRDRAAMRSLPPIAPETVFRNTVRLPRDYYVRAFTNDYSVDPSMIGRLVEVTANLDTVTVSHDGQLVASHDRAWARQLTITDPNHVAQAAVLRKQFQSLTSRWPAPAVAVETRDLASYDEIFGVDIETAEPLAVAS